MGNCVQAIHKLVVGFALQKHSELHIDDCCLFCCRVYYFIACTEVPTVIEPDVSHANTCYYLEDQDETRSDFPYKLLVYVRIIVPILFMR